jgi:cytochrome P450
MCAMNTPSTPQCPFHAQPSSAPPVCHPPGVWPSGPPAGLTGWGLLRRMSNDLLGTLGAWQQRFGDVVHLRIWPEHQIVVADPQLARDLLVTHHEALIRWERGMRVFSGLQGQSVFVSEGEAWRGKRHALLPNFSRKTVESFVPSMVAAVEQALARWPQTDRRWPIESALTSVTMDVILRMMFSTAPGDDARTAEQAVHTVMVAANAEFYWPASAPDWAPWKRAKRMALATLKDIVSRHLQDRVRKPRDAWPEDLLSSLLRMHFDDPAAWPLQAVHDECMTTFLAGHETAAAALTWWAWCMADSPKVQTAAREEVRKVFAGRAPTMDVLPSLRYLTQTLQETLRLYPGAPVLNSRRLLKPITLGAWQFPARTMFMVPVQLMHHDSRWFPEPKAFRPERFASGAPEIPRGAYLPFGAGPRVCLGQHLAMTELTVVAAMLLQRFQLSVPDGMTAPQPVFHVSLRPSRPLSLQLAPAPQAAAIST